MAMQARRSGGPVEQRRHARIKLAAAGRFVLDDAIEHHCRAIDISPGGLALTAPTRGGIGQRIVCYLDALGRIEGRIVRHIDAGFALEIAASEAKREKLAQQLAWHAERPHPPTAGLDRPERIETAPARAVLRLRDGRRVAVTIIDLSTGGACVLCPVPVAIGAPVTLDDRAAHVDRVALTVVGLVFDAAPAADGAF